MRSRTPPHPAGRLSESVRDQRALRVSRYSPAERARVSVTATAARSAAPLPAVTRLRLRSGRLVLRVGPAPPDSDSAASGPCPGVRLRPRTPTTRGAARPSSLPGRASAARLAVQPRPAPLRVACLSSGVVDASLPDSRCRRCRQSVEPADPPLLTARRLRPEKPFLTRTGQPKTCGSRKNAKLPTTVTATVLVACFSPA